jgi:phage terminase large subunit-like protein
MPEAALSRHEKTDKVEYRDWAKAGWLSITPGEVTDYTFIKTHIHDCELDNGWRVHEFCYDPYNASQFANDMATDGYTTVEIRQGVRTLSEPTKLLRDLVAQKKVVHDGNPLLRWCLANAKTETDSNGNIKLSKKNASDTKRIDLAVAVIDALVRLPALRGVTGKDISDAILDESWGM